MISSLTQMTTNDVTGNGSGGTSRPLTELISRLISRLLFPGDSGSSDALHKRMTDGISLLRYVLLHVKDYTTVQCANTSVRLASIL